MVSIHTSSQLIRLSHVMAIGATPTVTKCPHTSTSEQCGTLAVLQHLIDRRHYIIDGQGVGLQDPSSLM